MLATLPYDPSLRAELDAKPASELLVIYLNWCNRLVPSRPRTTYKSTALIQDPLATSRRADLDRLIQKIENGEDLTPHLSRRITVGYEQPPAKGGYNRREDLDLMLSEWQIHHLHISHVLDSDGFVKRDGPLLFAAFRPEVAYLIGIFGHGDWTRDAITEILIDEWPDSGFVHELRGNVIGLSHAVTETERGQNRNGGLSSPFVERNGKVYMVGIGGITSAGTAVQATQLANYIQVSAREFAQHISSNPSYIADALNANGVQPPATPDLHLYLNNDGIFGILERNTKALFPLATS